MAEADPHIADVHTARRALNGRKAIITGGTTGIGRAVAVLLASEGATVFTCGRNEADLAETLEQLNTVGSGHGMTCDLARSGELDRFFAEGTAQLGSYDIAILNAAVPAVGLTAMSEQEVRDAIEINFTGYLLGAHKAVRQMQAAGGDIIFTGSYATRKLGPSSTVYAGIKAGIHGFAEALRREVGPQGIKVGLVIPGLTASAMTTDSMSDEDQQRRIGEDNMLLAEDIAAGVHFMLTQPSRTVVQELILVPRNNEE
ncbi:short-chain dehydrogenase [Croceibacterium mercuriale]|uniref:Short-chain dehydrogenase n=1 Tax=Croceibacterium mercuriale TaxID=1572751 RepID=A0A0B2BZD3_9SPHN|nr:SDR family oxidoreductase [Croceibacterium mercuriale]KHL25387.1 short-chain dehydrogenase [Croceibacterium mercuriale]